MEAHKHLRKKGYSRYIWKLLKLDYKHQLKHDSRKI